MSSYKEAWSGGAMFGLCVLAFLIPLVGLIVGFMNLGEPERVGQASTILAIAGGTVLIVMMAL